jgi:hypothetical protein
MISVGPTSKHFPSERHVSATNLVCRQDDIFTKYITSNQILPIKNKLMVFERKVLRMIFGPIKERDGT